MSPEELIETRLYHVLGFWEVGYVGFLVRSKRGILRELACRSRVYGVGVYNMLWVPWSHAFSYHLDPTFPCHHIIATVGNECFWTYAFSGHRMMTGCKFSVGTWLGFRHFPPLGNDSCDFAVECANVLAETAAFASPHASGPRALGARRCPTALQLLQRPPCLPKARDTEGGRQGSQKSPRSWYSSSADRSSAATA